MAGLKPTRSSNGHCWNGWRIAGAPAGATRAGRHCGCACAACSLLEGASAARAPARARQAAQQARTRHRSIVEAQQNYYTLQRTRLYLGISVLFGMYRQIQSTVFRINRQTYGFRRWPPLGCMVAAAASCVQPPGKLGTSTADDWANHLD
eukprot:SAG31_NODE_5449_length_2532_cov_1.899712_3_plen_149_part_01